MRNTWYLIVLAVSMLCTAAAAEKLLLVKDNRPNSAIVVPDRHLPAVAYAAAELQYHIKRASGAELPVVKESLAAEQKFPHLIYIGECKATVARELNPRTMIPNSFIIKTLDSNLYIVGFDGSGQVLGAYNNTRLGTLFGVYEFLEKQLQVKWLWPGELGEVIPAVNNISVGDWDQTSEPRYRHNRWRTQDMVEGWSSEEARKRYMTEQDVWLRRQRFVVDVPMNIHHAFTQFWKRFGESHPEYFNLLPDGTRRPQPPASGDYVSMDVSNPALWQQIIEDWKAKRWPQHQPYIDASENDVVGKCVCPECLKWDASDVPAEKRLAEATAAYKKGDPDWMIPLGSLSDRYARFYLAVQKEAEKVKPNAVVMGFAYANYYKPPEKTKLNERIIIGIVPAMMFPWSDEKRAETHQQWKGWSATGAKLLLRPNYTLAGHCYPIFYADKLGEDLAYCAKNGLIGTDFDSLTGQWGTQGLNLYVLPRILNNPDLPVEQVFDEYYSAFGPAKNQVKAYFEYWKKISDGVTDDYWKQIKGTWDFYAIAHHIFTPEVMKKGFELLEQARQVAAGDKTASARVAFLKKGLKNAALSLQVQQALTQYRQDGNFAPYKQALNALDEYRQQCEPDNIANMGTLRYRERTRWPQANSSQEWGKLLDIRWKFSFDADKKGEESAWYADNFNDTAWPQIAVTDFWTESAVGKEWHDQNGKDYQGLGWYRTTFKLERPPVPRRYFLVFGAVHGTCRIWINGQEAYTRPYGGATDQFLRGPFQVEITSLVRFDRPNTVAVRTEYVDGAGGMWKPVWLYDAETTAETGKFQSIELDSANKALTGFTQDIPVEKGKTYKLRLWVKTSYKFNGRAEIAIGNKTAAVSSTDDVWAQVVIDGITASENQLKLTLNLANGIGSVSFNNVELMSN